MSVYFFCPPLDFNESLFLWKDAVMVMTDSGGLQEETTALGVPCMTLRENTERPITIEIGTNTLAGNRKEDIINCYRQIMENGKPDSVIPPKWDGKAAERIVDILAESREQGAESREKKGKVGYQLKAGQFVGWAMPNGIQLSKKWHFKGCILCRAIKAYTIYR